MRTELKIEGVGLGAKSKLVRVRDTQYSTVVRRLVDRHHKELERLGARVRTEVVKPICDKHQLHFLSGNGTWVFFNQRGDSFGSIEEAERLGYKMRRVFKVLEAPVDTHTDLGCWVSDYKPPGFK